MEQVAPKFNSRHLTADYTQIARSIRGVADLDETVGPVIVDPLVLCDSGSTCMQFLVRSFSTQLHLVPR
jgi:hypothetical protein